MEERLRVSEGEKEGRRETESELEGRKEIELDVSFFLPSTFSASTRTQTLFGFGLYTDRLFISFTSGPPKLPRSHHLFSSQSSSRPPLPSSSFPLSSPPTPPPPSFYPQQLVGRSLTSLQSLLERSQDLYYIREAVLETDPIHVWGGNDGDQGRERAQDRGSVHAERARE